MNAILMIDWIEIELGSIAFSQVEILPWRF
jgi:hypothetical protein